MIFHEILGSLNAWRGAFRKRILAVQACMKLRQTAQLWLKMRATHNINRNCVNYCTTVQKSHLKKAWNRYTTLHVIEGHRKL